jgi:hypothetical protein
MVSQIQECIDYFKYVVLDDLSNVHCWIAGGALREYFTKGNAHASDVDVFFPNKNQFDTAKKVLVGLKSRLTFENDRITNFIHKKHKVQLISTKYFNNPMATLQEFDFTVCCAAVDRRNVYLHETFFMDLAKKRLVINSLPYPLSTMQRMQRYVQKGYTICNQGILSIAKAVKELDFDKPEDNPIEFYPDGKTKFVRLD